MNKKYYNELINIKDKVIFIISNLDLKNISFNKNHIKNIETSLLTNNNYIYVKKIYKTMYSLIIIKNDILHCYNNNCYKQMSISNCETIYSNDEFYIKVGSTNNIIVFIDSEFKTKRLHSPLIINEIIVKKKYIMLIGKNNILLIEKNNIYNFKDYEVVDLYNFTLFYNIKKSLLINENMEIVDCKINNMNVKIILDSIKRFGKIENLINCYADEHL
jgi:hypothetical protein